MNKIKTTEAALVGVCVFGLSNKWGDVACFFQTMEPLSLKPVRPKKKKKG